MVRKTFRDLRKNWISFLSVFSHELHLPLYFYGYFPSESANGCDWQGICKG